MAAQPVHLRLLSGRCCRGRRHPRRHEQKPIDQALVARKSLDDATKLQVPDYYLCIFASTGNESIALAHVDIRDEV